MTEQRLARAITLRGREMWVRFPTEEQILIYSRTLKMLQGPEVQGWDGEQALKGLDRILRIVASVFTDPVDVEWIEDEMLDRKLTLIDACGMLQQAIEAFGDADDKPAKAAPRKRATRRKVTS